MESIHINFVAVLVVTIANFFVGFVWYTPLFGKVWARENGFDMSAKPPKGVFVRGLIMNVIGNFLMAYVFASNSMAWSFVPGMAEMSIPVQVFNAVFFTWLGFYLPVDLNTVAWEQKSWKLFAINTGYHFVTLLVAAIVLMLMS